MESARHESTWSNRPAADPAAGAPGWETTALPVCVDLDGTLIAGDLFWESLVRLLRRHPLLLFMLPFWALKGRAFAKHEIAQRVPVDAANLPYRREVLDILKAARVSGTRITLATGADSIHANQVAQHLGLFSEVIASGDGVNVSGRNKARILVERFGRGGFHYVGNDRSDLHVWAVAGLATVVGASQGVVRAAQRTVQTQAVVAPAKGLASSVVRAVRPHQWVKNLLVFVPLITSHKLRNVAMFEACTWTFVSFSLCASAIYILNDIADLDADRLHARKKFRPLAAGMLTVPAGWAIASTLLLMAIGVVQVAVSSLAALTLISYVVATSAYTMWLKREPVIDVFALAGLYVLRVWAGGVAAGIQLSNWLIGFALFFFLSLASVKRYTEVIKNRVMPGRGYVAEDASWMHGIGLGSGYMAALVLALYITAPDVMVLYERPRILWLVCPVMLFWITRMWFRAGRGMMHDDPVVDALTDPAAYVCALVSAIVIVLAS